MSQPQAFGKIKIKFGMIFIFPWEWYFLGYKIKKRNPFEKINQSAKHLMEIYNQRV
jgi:hypothetical protein